MDFLKALNDPQKEAVLHETGPLLVLAGAGSGKTRVITTRIARLLIESHVPPRQVLGVTFTNKAAREMLERVEHFFGGPVRGMWLTTFHAAGAKILRRHAEKVGRTPQFVIYDDSDQMAMVSRTIRDMGINERIYAPRAIQYQINTAKNFGLSPKRFSGSDFLGDVVAKVYPVYETRMEKANAVDFGDLLYLVTEIFEANEDVRKLYANRFLHILVDEFQDTNPVQYKLLQQLTTAHQNICVVGDDDQSIYRWRGADVKNILGFSRDFSNTTVIKLEENYRSTQNILRAAHEVIRNNFGRHEKTIFTQNPLGNPIHYFTLDNERREAETIGGIIRNLSIERGIPRSEIAVFYRTHAQSRAIEESLQRSQIPYRVVGGLKFYDRAEVKDLLAYLKVLLNRADEVSWTRIINKPTRGIGAKTIEKTLEYSKQNNVHIWRAIEHASRSNLLRTGPKKKVAAFERIMTELYELVEKLSPSELAREVLARTGYWEALEAEDTPESESRQENLRELLGSMAQYEQEMEVAETLESFLERVSLVNQDEESEDNTKERVTLMTVHAAKGLEFDAVIISGLEEGIFPHARARDDVDQMEEERRLCYVAITRAKQKLYLLNARRRNLFGRDLPSLPSRFLGDISKELLIVSGSTKPKRVAQPSWSPGSSIASSIEKTLPKAKNSEPELDFSVDQRSPEERASNLRFQEGMRVRHSVFGEGQIRKINGQGKSAVLTIFFQQVGVKKIQAGFVAAL